MNPAESELVKSTPDPVESLMGASETKDLLKGAAALPLKVQALNRVTVLLQKTVKDSDGALLETLINRLKQNELLLLQNPEKPELTLKSLIADLLKSEDNLIELVREVDAVWGRNFQERPYFQKPGQEAHPDDPYTHDSVKAELQRVLSSLG